MAQMDRATASAGFIRYNPGEGSAEQIGVSVDLSPGDCIGDIPNMLERKAIEQGVVDKDGNVKWAVSYPSDVGIQQYIQKG